MEQAEQSHNARVIAGTLSGFEGFHRFRSTFVDPLKNLLPVAVEVESVPREEAREYARLLEARGFFIDDRDAAEGRLRIAGPLDRFSLLEALEEALPAGFRELAQALASAVAHRFAESFDVPLRRRSMHLGRRPLVMGVLNVTPDSFSDGGLYAAPERAIERAFEMVEEGADLIDVGAESTRPGARPVSPQEELKRLDPVLRGLLGALRVPLSVDTRKAEVADRALELGADLINDASGLDHDPRLAEAVARRGGALVINHALGPPESMQEAPAYQDATAEICRSLRQRMARARRAGVAEERIILDPGIGFGKRVADNVDLLARVGELRSLGRPLLYGCSRKSFLGRLTGREPAERGAATQATTAVLALHGVKLIRVHDVRETCDALKVLEAIDDHLRLE